jgi:hypothetical protein
MSWKTQVGNEADKVTHGTSNRGERNGHAKLTVQQVLLIRESTAQLKQLASSFGVSITTISEVRNRKQWSWL